MSQNITSTASGRLLDGELANAADPNSLPSGNGTPGGNAVIMFDIVRDPADIDNDLDIDATDVSLFAEVLLGMTTNPTIVGRCDFNADGARDGLDIGAFVALLL